jgi:hypothetical protein
VGGSQQDLRQYVNSKVEIRGMLDHQGTAGAAARGAGSTGAGYGAGASTGANTGSTTGATTSPRTGAASTAAGEPHASMNQDGPKLHVTSVRQLAPSCAGENR